MSDYMNYLQLKKTVAAIEKALECPVCWERIRVPFRQCQRGHLICGGCLERLTACPLCKSKFAIPLNPTVVQNVLEALPTYCRYHSEGCLELQENNHDLYCAYRPAICRLSHCNNVSAMPLCKLLEHLQLNHKILMEDKPQIYLSFDNVLPVVFDNTLFWLSLKCSRDGPGPSILKLEALPIEAPNHNYYVSVKLEKGKFSLQDTIQAYVRKGGEKEGKKIIVDEIIKYEDVDYPAQDCMKIRHKLCLHFGFGCAINLNFFKE